MPTVDSTLGLASVTCALEAAGFVAADEEAEELITAAHGVVDLRRMLARRLTGEPLAWITGRAPFCGRDLAIEPGVYVPRWQSEPLALMATGLLPRAGIGVDLGTGSGAIAMIMQSAGPGARVVGTEINPIAARCARRNGVVVYEGDLCEPLPADLVSQVDVMTGVLPYVPSEALHLLPRDVQGFEPPTALDGGDGGLRWISRAVLDGHRWLRSGGWLLLEVGSDQVAGVRTMLAASGYSEIGVLEDGDGDERGIFGSLSD